MFRRGVKRRARRSASFLKHWLEQPELRDQFGAAGIGGSAGAGALATGRRVGFDDGDDGTVGYSEGAKSAAASWRRLRAGGRSSAAASAVRLQWRLDDALSDAMSEARVAGVPDRLRPRPGPCGFRHADETHALLALIRSDADASGSGSDDQVASRALSYCACWTFRPSRVCARSLLVWPLCLSDSALFGFYLGADAAGQRAFGRGRHHRRHYA
eukprot:3486734-Pleurochrysis_carterae.AAC.4